MQEIRAILFDKDGTLFDFQATWSAWADALLSDLAGGDGAVKGRMAEVIHFDLNAAKFQPGSPVIAGTGREVAELLAPFVNGQDVAALEQVISRAAAVAPLVPAVALRPLLEGLRRAGYKLGVATNDFDAVAREHLAEIIELFDFIAGFDSGFGGKPDPGMLLAFARHCGLPPRAVLMVGDSRHDLVAGRAAGMPTLAVLTGVASEADLAPFADVVRPDIGHLPELLRLT